MNGFGNALNIMDINDEDIQAVEESIRDCTIDYLTKKVMENVDDGCEILVPMEMLEEYFGEAYKFAPEKFKFLAGDRKTIKKVSEHVQKIVDSLGESKGLKHFAPKRKPTTNTATNTQKVQKIRDKGTPHASDDEIDEMSTESLQKLETVLFEKIWDCLKTFKVEQIVDLETVDQNIVSVFTENGRIYGNVYCVICANGSNLRKQTPKRVQYYSNNGKQYWVPSNFTSHLKNIHKLSGEKCRAKKSTVGTVAENQFELIDESKYSKDLSLEIVSIDGAVISKPDIDKNQFYLQISTQINNMCEVVLQYNEEEHTMISQLSGSENYEIKIVEAAGDGNCLFTSLAHQLFYHNMKSNAMKKASKKLRADVVAHIEKNMDAFQHELKGRVYEIIENRKNSSDYSDSDSYSYDMDAETKHFMKELSANGYYGGSETLKAVSNLYDVNIIIFNEEEKCHIVSKFGMTHEKTIGVAYRLNGLGGRDHYDSVTDIKSDSILALVNCVYKN